MLKNTFRKLIGYLIVIVFGIAIFRFVQQTWGNQYVLAAIGWGSALIILVGGVLYLAYLFDRRMKKREQ